jgi:hypothetical protein
MGEACHVTYGNTAAGRDARPCDNDNLPAVADKVRDALQITVCGHLFRGHTGSRTGTVAFKEEGVIQVTQG